MKSSETTRGTGLTKEVKLSPEDFRWEDIGMPLAVRVNTGHGNIMQVIPDRVSKCIGLMGDQISEAAVHYTCFKTLKSILVDGNGIMPGRNDKGRPIMI